jgi:hypothetical protein
LNFQSESVSDYSVEALKTFAHVRRSHRQVDLGRRSESKHGSDLRKHLNHPKQRFGIKIPPHFDPPSAGLTKERRRLQGAGAQACYRGPRRLYRPESGRPEAYDHLQPILTRPIDWNLIQRW